MPQGRLQLQLRILALFTASSFGLVSNSGVLAATEKVRQDRTAIAANPFLNGTVSPLGVSSPGNWTATPLKSEPTASAPEPEKPSPKPEEPSAAQAEQPVPLVSWADRSVPPKAVMLCVHGLGL